MSRQASETDYHSACLLKEPKKVAYLVFSGVTHQLDGNFEFLRLPAQGLNRCQTNFEPLIEGWQGERSRSLVYSQLHAVAGCNHICGHVALLRPLTAEGQITQLRYTTYLFVQS